MAAFHASTDEVPRLNSRVRLALVCLLIVVSAVFATSLLYFRPVSLPNINLTHNQYEEQVVNVDVTVLDSSEGKVAWAEVDVTYSCDYITQQGAMFFQSPNGTNRITLDCGLGYSPHHLSLHVTVTAFGFNDYSFTDMATFYGTAKELEYVVHLTHSPFIQSGITLENFSLCINIRPKLTNLGGIVHVRGNMPIISLHLIMNGTDMGSRPLACPLANIITTTVPNGGVLDYGIVFAVQLTPNANITVLTGEDYIITLTATFYDGSTSTASTSVVTQSGACIPYP